MPGLIHPAPARVRVGNPAQRIAHRIQVGADVQAEVLEVIPGIDHDGERFGRQAARQAIHQLGAAHPTSQSNDLSCQRILLLNRLLKRTHLALIGKGKAKTT